MPNDKPRQNLEGRAIMKFHTLLRARDAGEPPASTGQRPVLPGSRRTRFCLTISSLLLLGCAATDHRAAPSAPAGPSVVGSVAVVDEERRFVLIDLESGLYVPPPGVVLRTANASGETGRLRTSPEEKRPFVAADIVQGNPAVGDQVLQ